MAPQAGTSSRPETTSPIGTNSPRLRCMVYSPMFLRQDREPREKGLQVHAAPVIEAQFLGGSSLVSGLMLLIPKDLKLT